MNTSKTDMEVLVMTSTEIRAKLDKALETVAKKEATIVRHEAQADKKLAKITELGISTDPMENREVNEHYWLCCEYRSKVSDIEEAKKKLEDAKRIALNWEEKLARQLEVERKLHTEIPEVFTEARNHLVESWVESDIRARDKMLQAKKDLEYKEFRKLYRYTEEESLKHTDEEFRKIEEREADYWLLNLYNRVYAITGEVTDAKHITWGGKCLDGYVVGKNGVAEVETIGAGGYNIQRFHLRVLVKERA